MAWLPALSTMPLSTYTTLEKNHYSLITPIHWFMASFSSPSLPPLIPLIGTHPPQVTSAHGVRPSDRHLPNPSAFCSRHVYNIGKLTTGLTGAILVQTWAGLTQLVECQLPKLDVAGSNPVSRSIFFLPPPNPPHWIHRKKKLHSPVWIFRVRTPVSGGTFPHLNYPGKDATHRIIYFRRAEPVCVTAR